MSIQSWSLDLQRQTFDAIEEIRVAPNGRMNFKHKTLGYAYLLLEDILNDRLSLHDKCGNIVSNFEDVSELISVGWVID
jgi:hypothetical protein